MFKKVLIANRGEIALRIIQTCREMGIASVALYQEADESSLHVRLADECVLITSAAGFMDQVEILRIAGEKSAEAVHPGYGFLAEDLDFVRACEAAGVVFIGPPGAVVEQVSDKLAMLSRVHAAGVPTVETSQQPYFVNEVAALRADAERLGYPVLIKACSGGRSTSERPIHTPEQLEAALRGAHGEVQSVYGTGRVFLKKVVLPAHQISVQVLADRHGNCIHLEEREGSVLHNGQKVIEESPAPCLSPAQRAELHQVALKIARMFGYENLGTIEFLVDRYGQFFFTQIKPRIQVEHPLTEMRARIDLVREQIRIAAGEPLSVTQDGLNLQGWAMLCRINAEDPYTQMPSPGAVRVRLPLGAEVRFDTYIADQGIVPSEYNPLIAKLTTWGGDRDMCLQRMRRALQDVWLPGGHTNVPVLQNLLAATDFCSGAYFTDFQSRLPEHSTQSQEYYRDLAVASAVLHVKRHQFSGTIVPERLNGGWHRDSRRLPE